ncbi:WAT1-related protein At3g18200 [Cucurbita moschata]|uniref:WAT1-related protein n=1 Tax=Cucurbita moschata TaxID=3662 RepID=A0A6J1EFW8_CUCMO|nr:WAT1-related protein At3g18200 [Cucurbita moschata]
MDIANNEQIHDCDRPICLLAFNDHTAIESEKRRKKQTKMAKGKLVSEKIKLILALIALQFCYAGFHIVSRVALNIGVSKVVYPVYRNAIALALLSPFAYFLEKNERPPLTFSLLFQFFLLALLGITANQGFYLLGLNNASPTFASAMQNSVPAITFVMASVLRLEQINFRRRDGLAKLLGTIGSVGGATVITLYRGPPLFHNLLTQGSSILGMDEPTLKVQNWRWGCIYLLGHCLSWAGWMVFQASVLKKYPAKLTITSYTCFFGLIQFLVIAGFVETDYQYWKIQSAEELFTILYAGVVASGIVISLQTWCIQNSDPVFVAVFQPLQTFLVAIMAFLILGDRLFSGGVIGAVLITFGLYLVLWGKSKEKALEEEEDKCLKQPLLEDQKGDKEDNVVSDIP